MTTIRALERDDLPVVASLYAELDGYDPAQPAPGYLEFFRRTLLDPPLADPELPALVYEDPDEGVVGVIGSHPRRFLLGERPVRLACAGPLIVHPRHRERGLGALLLRRFAAGPQDMSFNDRSADEVYAMWLLLGAAGDSAASIEWSRVLAPAGYATKKLARRVTGRPSPPGGAAAAALDGVVGRRRRPPRPESGRAEQLEAEDLIELIPRLRRQFTLRPDYSPAYLESLFELLGWTVLGDRVVRRLVRNDEGRPLGAYVMCVARHGSAHVLDVTVSRESAGLVLEHLLHDAAEAGAVEVEGRVEAVLLPHLARLGCRLRPGAWVTVRSQDAELEGAALSGKSLISRLDGEWWMRPRHSLD